MTTQQMLHQTHQARKCASELNYLAEMLFKNHIQQRKDSRDSNPLYAHFLAFSRQVITLNAYLDDLLEQLEWRNLLWQKIKREFSDMGWFITGAFLGILLWHLFN